MKKAFRVILFIIVLVALSVGASAEENFGADEIESALPEQARDYLDEADISPDNNGILNVSAESLLDVLWNTVSGELTKPLKMLASLSGVIILMALADTMRDSASKSGGEAFRIVGVLAGAGMMTGYISECVISAATTVEAVSTFMLTFIPVFAGIVAINGQITTATIYNAVLIGASQVFSQLCTMFIMPMSSAILGISAAGSVNGDLHIDRLAELIKKIVFWGLSLLVTLFVGLLSLQSFVTVSADNVTMKAAKFAVSTTIPIVGGAVSEALSTVKSTMGIMKGSIGTFGMISGALVILPSLVSAFCFKLALFIAGAVSDLFGTKALTELIKSGECVMSIVIAVLFCFMLLLSVSTAVILFSGAGVTV